MNLVIVESPTKAKTISRFVGTDFVVKSSFGHIRDLPKSELGVDVENKFETGAAINPQAMLKTGLICLRKGRLPKVKILGGGEVTKKFFVGGCLVSKSVKEKIVKAGGEVK